MMSPLGGFLTQQKRLYEHFPIARSLAMRELKARYRGSWLGFSWAFVEPLVLSAIFFFIFVIIFQQQYHDYLLYLLTGLLPFFAFSNSVNKATGSMMAFGTLIRQVYCPREIFAMVGILGEFFHFALALFVLIPAYLYYQTAPPPQVIFVLPATLLLMLFSYGIGLFFASLSVFVRDTSIFVGLVMRLWFYLCPIFYTMGRLEDTTLWVQIVYKLNPLVPLLSIFRWALVATEPPPDPLWVGIMLVQILVVLVGGALFFHVNENSMVKML